MTQGLYQLLPRSSADLEQPPISTPNCPRRSASYLRTCVHLPCKLLRRLRSRRVLYLLVPLLMLVAYTALLNPSYTSPPPFTQPKDESLYIAGNNVDEALIRGAWGDAIVELARTYPPAQVYVSVYGSPTSAMEHLDQRLEFYGVPRTIVSQELSPINMTELSHVIAPNGERMVKRIEYLAEVRNRALRPLKKLPKRYHKVLFLNDVVFSPQDALRLLYSTTAAPVSNATEAEAREMRTSYRAACALDFINPFKFYDTYATRDTGGYYPGVPIFPFFSGAGSAVSRRDVVANKEAVRVKSCWGGMVAFDGRFLQSLPPPIAMAPKGPDESQRDTANQTREQYSAWLSEMYGPDAAESWEPIRFRSEPQRLWDASECCLIHADIARPAPDGQDWEDEDVGIYMNPYVRVAYESLTYDFLWLSKRLERLLIIPQQLLNWCAEMPRGNAHRQIVSNQVYPTRVWQSDDVGASEGWEGGKGHYENSTRVAGKGGFCGVRQLLVWREMVEEGEKNWVKLPIPPAEEGMDS
ncbi:MAG: hypothetical protein M1818_003740 [Claussenomyces sp. TS43310]|nr:MAG: hypothetical protein M1818_003740 [Claussenomyces sp. TS43310]